MKIKYIATIISALLIINSALVFGEDYSAYEGRIISKINIKTVRISPQKAASKFTLKEGSLFTIAAYDEAKQSLHNMRIFKTIDFTVSENSDKTVNIDIDAKDSYYIFPIVMATGGSNNMFGGALMESNLFKAGELVFLSGMSMNDGYAFSAGFGLNSNFFSVSIAKFDHDEKQYANGSFNSPQIKADSAELNQFGIPLRLYNIQTESMQVQWSFPIIKSLSFSIAYTDVEVKYFGKNAPTDFGKHNKVIFALRKSRNFSGGGGMGGAMASMGALFGIGISDVSDIIAKLAKPRYGYALNLNYENGGNLTGADYNISKLYFGAAGLIEFRSRNTLTANLSAAKAFESPFFDLIRSGEVLSRGRYLRDFRGENAIGAGLSYNWNIIKSKIGILALVPYIESAAIGDQNKFNEQTGIGAVLSYRLWRFPFPLGVNFSQSISDNSFTASFLFGGRF
ncbi:MAG: hypothetical protein LBV16_03770 [Elusimicrobiota bacterium]|jgi:outer membrane protein assembly factor BamA|nr:hypothetical protein [Elusimicrobiota bacterium]